MITKVDQHQVIDGSKLTTYMSCPRKFFFEYILGWRSIYPNHDLEFGTAWHEGMEVLMKEGLTAETAARAYEAFLSHYRKHFTEVTDMSKGAKCPSNAELAYIEYVKKYKLLDNFETLFVEVSGSMPINETDIIYFKMDSICKRDNGQIFSLEHKTSKMLTAYWHDQWMNRIQMGIYNHVLCSIYGFENVEGIIVNGAIFRKKGNDYPRVPIYKTIDTMEDWLNTVNYWLKLWKNDVEMLEIEQKIDKPHLTCFMKNPEACFKYNRTCSYFNICNAWKNPLQRTEDIPHDMKVEHWDPREHGKTTVEEVKATTNL